MINLLQPKSCTVQSENNINVNLIVGESGFWHLPHGKID